MFSRRTSALAAAGVLLALGGCANSAKLTYLPNGNTGFAINCSGSDASSGWGDCYKQASDACGAYGYDVVSKDDEKGAASGGSIIGVFGANIKNRSMVIQCKK
ncbi:lipoprotein [Robbsia andropogonis]|uniref:Lipoprotein n=1 Tax=Robbsia andropogonis TaxID=28092 RepID=A0A0F5K3L5_9BURK|nr:lipoprotein [Robbsia andropogonis]